MDRRTVSSLSLALHCMTCCRCLLSGLNPSTVEPAFLKGSLITYWRLLNSDGYVLNWNGDVSRRVVDAARYIYTYRCYSKWLYLIYPSLLSDLMGTGLI